MQANLFSCLLPVYLSVIRSVGTLPLSVSCSGTCRMAGYIKLLLSAQPWSTSTRKNASQFLLFSFLAHKPLLPCRLKLWNRTGEGGERGSDSDGEQEKGGGSLESTVTDEAAVNRKACSRTRHLPNSPFLLFIYFFLFGMNHSPL